MTKYKVKSNLLHNGVLYTKGNVVEMGAEYADQLLRDKVIVMLDEEVDEDEPTTPQPPVNVVKRRNGETTGEAEVEPGKEVAVEPDAEEAQEPTTKEYRALKGVEFPRGTVHKVGDVFSLTDEQAKLFAEGLIEEVEGEEDSL